MSNNYYAATYTNGIVYTGPISTRVDKVPEMPAALEGVSQKDIQAAFAAINNSKAQSTISSLEYLASQPQLKDWELKMVQKAYEEFLAKHKSPLLDALK